MADTQDTLQRALDQAHETVPLLENLQLHFMRSILICAGYLEWDGRSPHHPDPVMDAWEMFGRAWHLHEWQTGLTDAETYEEWIEGHYEQEQVAGLLNNLALVVAPRPSSVS
jgi:hypothetical protein